VEPARLMAKGYGPTRPIVPNITQQNRARNRRVQFRIVRRVELSAAAKP
jgi:outer membrane protein OmpA-like peptidoglycan-associated protein